MVSTLLGAALISALRALRPIFPKEDRLIWREEPVPGGTGSEHRSAAPLSPPVNLTEGRELETVLTTLARRKFRAIKLAIDLTVAAISVAGLGLLLTVLTA
ncbi:hypothetical protein OG723_40375 [Streptomyces sp. NBC_01278]|uniref:hypothetical protein n=1 Tax=Streptomyces sp. NBC_01278 TaxID=2903809 RepID=UPI002E374665|nr:hypothetical protein [Streptomyces sp. NBC_01278]